MNKICLLIFIVAILFSGCSGIGGSQNGFFGFGGFSSSNNDLPEVDNSGTGLRINFDLDNENIKVGRLIYKISIENSGSELVTLDKSNFELSYANYKNLPIIKSESRDAFYNKIFGESNQIKLYQDQEFEQSGVLIVSKELLESQTKDNFVVNLESNYFYETDFVSNLELVEEYDMFEIVSGDSFKQASPIQVNNLKLIPSYDAFDYILEVTLNDKGDRGDVNDLNDAGILINNFEINFGNKKLSCSVKGDDKKSFLIKKNSKLVLECPVTIDNKEDFVTQVTGSFDYQYNNFQTITVNIPTN